MSWTKQEIEKTAKILNKAEHSKSMGMRLFDETIHWLMITLTLLGNLLVVGILILSSLILPISLLYTVAAIVGIVFGWLLEMPLAELEKLHVHKHFLARVFMPLLALVTLVVYVGSGMTVGLNQTTTLLSGGIYAICFLLPHVMYHITSILKKNKK